jgi:hypothetical protein
MAGDGAEWPGRGGSDWKAARDVKALGKKRVADQFDVRAALVAAHFESVLPLGGHKDRPYVKLMTVRSSLGFSGRGSLGRQAEEAVADTGSWLMDRGRC